MSGSAKRLRRTVRREVTAAVGVGLDMLWAERAKLRTLARLRLAWRLIRGRAFNGSRIESGS